MEIQHLKLTNFRNIASANINVGNAKIIILHGENGAGKTNLLESISLLSPGRGLNKAKKDEQAKNGEKSWGLHASVSSRGECCTIGMDWDGKKRRIKVDGGLVASQSKLAEVGSIMWFTPRMDRLFLDSAQPRRDFVDRLVYALKPNHAKNISKYKHHVRSRMKLLKAEAASDWIELEERQAAELALQITASRNEYLTMLGQYLNDVKLNLSGSFEKTIEEINSPPLDFICKKFASTRERDLMIGSTMFGVHRSDLLGELLTAGTSLSHASSGQHKKAILHILLCHAKLIHAHTGSSPALLLDEVVAHLDENSLAATLEDFSALGIQIWLTGTKKDSFAILNSPLFIKVASGQFSL